MARAPGDANLSLREKRLKAENEMLKVDNAALKQKVKILQRISKLRTQELTERLEE